MTPHGSAVCMRSPPKPQVPKHAERASWLWGVAEPLLLAPVGCPGAQLSGLGSSGWFVKDIPNGHSKPRQGGVGGGRGSRRLIGGTRTCAGTPALQAKDSLLEEGHLGPQQGGQTQVRGRWVQRWGWTWMEFARARSSRAGAGGRGMGASASFLPSQGFPYGPGAFLPLGPLCP